MQVFLFADAVKLVIVGKQSAGKSSLLQSLTDIPFPIGGKLCTRFATRIVSRRGPSDMVSSSIEPGEIDAFNYRENDINTEYFGEQMTSLSPEKFNDIVEDVRFMPYCEGWV